MKNDGNRKSEEDPLNEWWEPSYPEGPQVHSTPRMEKLAFGDEGKRAFLRKAINFMCLVLRNFCDDLITEGLKNCKFDGKPGAGEIFFLKNAVQICKVLDGIDSVS